MRFIFSLTIFLLLWPSQAWALEPYTQDMILIPAGKINDVSVDSFYIDPFEVTQKEYQKVMNVNLSFFKNPDHPVEKVNWYEASQYCQKLGKRLPTEWEWEWAARAGTDSEFYWKGSSPDEFAWHKGNSQKQSHPVGQKKPNGFGLFDMAGNVWEWTASDHENGGNVLRGGSWRNSENSLASSKRILGLPIYRFHYVGFRCARRATPGGKKPLPSRNLR